MADIKTLISQLIDELKKDGAEFKEMNKNLDEQKQEVETKEKELPNDKTGTISRLKSNYEKLRVTIIRTEADYRYKESSLGELQKEIESFKEAYKK